MNSSSTLTLHWRAAPNITSMFCSQNEARTSRIHTSLCLGCFSLDKLLIICHNLVYTDWIREDFYSYLSHLTKSVSDLVHNFKIIRKLHRYVSVSNMRQPSYVVMVNTCYSSWCCLYLSCDKGSYQDLTYTERWIVTIFIVLQPRIRL